MHPPESQRLPPDSILLMASSDILQDWYRIMLTTAPHSHRLTTEFEPDIAAIRDARLREDFPVLHAACRDFTRHVASASHQYPPGIAQAAAVLDHALADLEPPTSTPPTRRDPTHHTITPRKRSPSSPVPPSGTA